MKTVVKFVAAGIVVVIAILLRQDWYPTNQSLQTTTTSAASNTSFHTHAHHDPMNHAVALLRSKLKRWQDSLATNPDDDESQDELMQEMLAMLTDENVAQIVQSLSAEEMNTPFGVAALHRWMQSDPLNATDWLANRPETTEQQTLAVADDWREKPADLQKCIDQLPASEWKQNFLNDVGSEMAFDDPQSAINLAQQMEPGARQTNLLQSVACTWVDSDPDAALNWVAGVQDPALREQLIASAVQSYALSDPAQAAAWLVSEVKSQNIVQSSALNVVETWAMQDPAAAADWVTQFPEGTTKTSAIQTIAKYWRQTDPAAASAWIQNFTANSH